MRRSIVYTAGELHDAALRVAAKQGVSPMRRMFCAVVLTALLATLACSAQVAETPETLVTRSQAVLAQLDGDIKLSGLKEPVEVNRDRWGVAHIYAKNADDLFFAQGFVVAQDRLFQIDWWRRAALGETSEIIGKKGL